MLELIALVAFIIFILGVLVGVQCQEINLRRRERRLATEQRRFNDHTCALTRTWT